MLRVGASFFRNENVFQCLQRLHFSVFSTFVKPERSSLLGVGIEIGIVECRVRSYLEIHCLPVIVADFPHYLYLVACQLIADFQCKCVRVFCQCFRIGLELVPQCVFVRRDQMEIHVSGESMLFQRVFFSVDSIFLVPQAADYREEHGCMAFPESRIRLPDEFSSGMVSDAP